MVDHLAKLLHSRGDIQEQRQGRVRDGFWELRSAAAGAGRGGPRLQGLAAPKLLHRREQAGGARAPVQRCSSSFAVGDQAPGRHARRWAAVGGASGRLAAVGGARVSATRQQVFFMVLGPPKVLYLVSILYLSVMIKYIRYFVTLYRVSLVYRVYLQIHSVHSSKYYIDI
jgi:hypothetical protein